MIKTKKEITQEYFNFKQAMEYLGLSKSNYALIHSFIEDGLKVVYVGNSQKISKSDLDAYMESKKSSTKEPNLEPQEDMDKEQELQETTDKEQEQEQESQEDVTKKQVKQWDIDKLVKKVNQTSQPLTIQDSTGKYTAVLLSEKQYDKLMQMFFEAFKRAFESGEV